MVSIASGKPYSDYAIRFSIFIRRQMRDKKITVRELVERSGVSWNQVVKVRNAKACPSIFVAHKILQALSASWQIGIHGTPTDTPDAFDLFHADKYLQSQNKSLVLGEGGTLETVTEEDLED